MLPSEWRTISVAVIRSAPSTTLRSKKPTSQNADRSEADAEHHQHKQGLCGVFDLRGRHAVHIDESGGKKSGKTKAVYYLSADISGERKVGDCTNAVTQGVSKSAEGDDGPVAEF